MFGSEAVSFATMRLERDVFDKGQDSEGNPSGTIFELNNCFVFGFVGILVLYGKWNLSVNHRVYGKLYNPRVKARLQEVIGGYLVKVAIIW